MIGIIVKEMPFLKLLTPIMDELHSRGIKYILYYMDLAKPGKEYARPTVPRLKMNGKVVERAVKIHPFTEDKKLMNELVQDKVSKVVSVELWLFAQKYISFFKEHKIKPYSISYLSDTLWQKYESSGRVYYSTEHLLKTYLKFNSLPMNNDYKSLGSPLFDCIDRTKHQDNILVLLPNIRVEMVSAAFGGTKNFIKIIEKLYKGCPNLIFKTRKKQWFPPEIKQYAKEIIDDGDLMYPTAMGNTLKRTKTVVMFYSSGVYECAYSGNYIVNIPLPTSIWRWDKNKLSQYLSNTPDSLYQFNGVIESVPQQQVLSDAWQFIPRSADPEASKSWISKFIGNMPINSAKAIVDDILNN